jgi:GTP pyrophosphokinase
MSDLETLTITDVLHLLPEGVMGAEARDLVRRAYDYALDAHGDQKRKSGDPFIQHPLHVAQLLVDFNLEPAVIAAGLLHDVLEDCDVTRNEMRDHFGEEVLTLVEGVTKLEEVEELVKEDSHRERDLQELESLRKLLIAMAEDDIRIIFIKLADRLHNMRTLKYLPPPKQVRVARETLEIFAPVANRLGIWVWKAELEDLSFRYLNPRMYGELAELLDARREERQQRVQGRARMLRKALAGAGLQHTTIKGRPKHIYSIYHKMRRKNVPFARIYDAEGLRVIVDSESACYQVLGIVHSLWKPVPGEFDDYIAHPKPNGYQSLHTAVITGDGKPLEIQIRTAEMDHFAEYGVAAHWRYKEGGVQLDPKAMRHISLMRQSVQEYTQDAGDARSFIASIRSDVFRERVYVFTPKGKVIDLPIGATPLDFAYYVHTEVGHGCRGARVNGAWTPLDYQLRTGDQVEIITGRKGGPSRDWINEELGFTKTNRARQKIKQWFRRRTREQNADQGRAVVEKILKRLGLDIPIEEVAGFFRKRYHRTDEFLAAVGMGDITGGAVVSRLEAYISEQTEDETYDEELAEDFPPPPPEMETGSISVRGTGGLLTHLAKCCNPLPGEEIIGYVTRGHGVSIHRKDCSNVLQLSPKDQERLIEVGWGGAEQHTFPVQIVIHAYDRSRLLHDISGVVANNDINIAAVSTGKRDRYNIMPVYITLEVPDLSTLTRVLMKIEQISNVIDAHRQV